jgi:5-methyltetrahydropteroyltriglutamate--homocysteine methyltransferase
MVHVVTTITGSYPPIVDEEGKPASVKDSIRRAVDDQIAAGLDLLTDGQIRADIVSLFARHIPGFEGDQLPYSVADRITPAPKPITVDDHLFAKSLAPGRPFKAHITGPTIMAQTATVDLNRSPYQSNRDPSLILDIARALAQEARAVRGQGGARYIQIDEPSLGFGADLEVALQAVDLIAAEVEYPILHICGDVRHILKSVLDMEHVKAISIEGKYLRQMAWLEKEVLAEHGKQIGYGCIRVDTSQERSVATIQRDIAYAVQRLGAESIWAVHPECGLRQRTRDVALDKVTRMVEATRNLEKIQQERYATAN